LVGFFYCRIFSVADKNYKFIIILLCFCTYYSLKTAQNVQNPSKILPYATEFFSRTTALLIENIENGRKCTIWFMTRCTDVSAYVSVVIPLDFPQPSARVCSWMAFGTSMITRVCVRFDALLELWSRDETETFETETTTVSNVSVSSRLFTIGSL